MQLGVCYYPEHWPEERWALDAKLMRQAGLSLVRIAEFAWALMEPQEGEYSWGWLDRAIVTLAAEELKVILGTPTASPPPWLSRAYPETLPVDVQGHRRRHGSRRHYCPNSPIYHKLTERIVSQMANRYGKDPAVVGWQIDNEFGCHWTARCYCETCAAAFRTWLQQKYRHIDALNQAWGNIFWSQVYGDWDEIDPPNLTIAGANPSHYLDYYRFSSDSYVSYQDLQFSILRAAIPENQIITTNLMSKFTDLDYHDLAEPLDLVTMSSYPTGHADAQVSPSLYMPEEEQPEFPYDIGDPYSTGLGYTFMRGFKPGRPFWVMEQQCGNINWSTYNTGVRPGTVRLWTWHALASGAEAVLYFRWRASLFAQEQYHSGLLRHDASPGVGYTDVETMKADRALMSEIASQPHTARIAILLDYDSVWSLQLQPHRREFGFLRSIFLYYRAAQRLGLPIDVVAPTADLSQYKIVILPTASLATQELADTLKSFAESGGTVLLGVRSGFKTPDNQFTERPLPGLYSDLVGILVTEWHSLPPGTSYGLNANIPDLDEPATVWAERLHPGGSDLEVLAHYQTGPFTSAAALTEHRVGAGRAFYLGWYPTGTQAKALIAHLAAQAGVSPLASLSEGLIVSRRGPYLMLLNFTEEPQETIVNGEAVKVGPRDVEVVKNGGT